MAKNDGYRPPFFRRWLRWLGLGLALAFAGTGLLLLAAVSIPLPPLQAARATEIYDANDDLVTKLFIQNRTPVPLSQIPEELRRAVITVEDRGFYRHFGIDPLGIARAVVRNISAGKVVEGGSTITQQLARNLYNLTFERRLSRKVRELFITLQIEARYTKSEILEMYLNSIYFGGGAYGVEAASQLYFGKHVQDLTLAETALLAGLPRGPELFSPLRNPDLARSRRNTVLDILAAAGEIDAARAESLKNLPVELAERPTPTRARYFVDYVISQIRERHPGLEQNLSRGGYKIYTTLDVKMQEAAEQAVEEQLAPGTPDERGLVQPQVALVSIDPRNGFIKAMVGGRGEDGIGFNRAVTAKRQPGSAFKPFLYAAVLSSGYTAADLQTCEYVSFPGAEGAEPYTPTDYTNGGRRDPYHWRPLSVREAVEISDNVVAVKWAATIGPDRIVEMARRLGVQSRLEASLPLALGTSEVTPLEMAAAYVPFANMGWRAEPLAIRRIVDFRGRVIEENRPSLAEVLDEGVAFILSDILKGVIERGTASNINGWLGRPAAAKTGTTDNNEDAWFVGYTPDLVTAVWVGNDIPSQLPGFGSTLAGPVWADYTGRALDNVAPRDFPQPSSVVQVAISAADGLLPNPTSPVVNEFFLAGTQPRITSPLYRWGGIWPGDQEGQEGRSGPLTEGQQYFPLEVFPENE